MPGEKIRVKDKHADHNHVLDQLSPELQAFNAELMQKFPEIRYTSGKRSASSKVGKYSKVSHHNTGNAVDIGRENEEVFDYLMNTREGLQLLNKYSLGIIDETDPETLKKTGGTAPHFHIGKDSKYAQIAKDRYTNFEKLEPITSFIASGKSSYQMSPSQAISQPSPIVSINPTIPFKLESGVVVGMPVNVELFEKEIEKEVVKDEMVQASPARQKLEVEQQKRRNFLEGFKVDYANQKPIETAPSQEAFTIPPVEQISVQDELPVLPSLFSLE